MGIVSEKILSEEISNIPTLKVEFEERFGFFDYDYYSNILGEEFTNYYTAIQKECAFRSALLKEIKGKNHTIYCDFINSFEQIAGVLTVSKELSFIYFSIGMWVKMKILFQYLCPTIEILDFDFVKTTDLYHADIHNLQGNLLDEAFSKNDTSIFELLESINNQLSYSQKRTAGSLLVISMEYLFTHELMHIALGHTQFLASDTFRSNSFQEFNFGKDIKQENSNGRIFKFLQVMELHADIILAQYLTSGLSRGILMSQKTKEKKEVLVSQCAIAWISLIATLDRQSLSYTDYSNHTHPHPGVRLVNFLAGIEDNIRNIDNNDYFQLYLDIQKATIIGLNKIGMKIEYIQSFHDLSYDELALLREYEYYTNELNRGLPNYMLWMFDNVKEA